MIGLGFCFEDPLESLPLRVIFTRLGTGFLFNDCEGVYGQPGFADFLPGTYDFTGGVADGGIDRVPAVVDVLGKVA